MKIDELTHEQKEIFCVMMAQQGYYEEIDSAYSNALDFLGIEEPNDNKFIIHGIRGAMPHAEDIKSCYKDMNQVVESVSNMFKNAKKVETTYDHPVDRTGNSKVKEVYFLFKSDDEIKILCSDFEENLRIKNNWNEGLSIWIRTPEIVKWYKVTQ